ncbi:hypothetical protein O181_102376 [Austropuccinia psidii MF-1]|uniref:Uncharacterized protein n=1 Tax=Austropuccinia psidii MF-1 TaxID=1389203 RepID=A0A9Q3JIJ3_9BASI|nr:hypothetical protein [Austropuccinia psidii MF-1]
MEPDYEELLINDERKDNLIKDLAEIMGESWTNIGNLPGENGRYNQNQLTEEEKEILELFNGFFNFEAQNSEAKSLAQNMELNNPDYFNNKYTYPEEIPNTQSQSHNDTTDYPMPILDEKKITRNRRVKKFTKNGQQDNFISVNKVSVSLKLDFINKIKRPYFFKNLQLNLEKELNRFFNSKMDSNMSFRFERRNKSSRGSKYKLGERKSC